MKNLGQMMKQAQEMQTRMAEMQAKLEEAQIDGASGGGLVSLTLTGKGDVRRIKIDASLCKPEEVDMLEDLILAAFNDARRKVETHMQEEMAKLTGGLKLPPGFKLPFEPAMRLPSEIERLIRLLARLPGLGPRSARRAALYLLQRHETVLYPLAEALQAAGKNIRRCSLCNTLDTSDPCGICRDSARDSGLVCVVEQVADQWAVERTGVFTGRYHVLGGVLSALDGIGPEGLGIDRLLERIAQTRVYEVILALNATVDGQTTAHYLAERLQESGVTVTRLAHGVPVGGELDYLDDGTLTAALTTRRRAE